jgi:BolA protein
MMSVSAQMLHDLLQTQLKPRHLQVFDESAEHAGHAGSNGQGHGTHFRVRIGDPSFDPLPRLKRHRLVYDAVQDLMQQGIHALAVEVVQCD